MANLDTPDAVIVSTALGRLEKLSTDEYIISFGPNDRQFFATPNGYSATQLPMTVLGHISAMPVRKVTWASYGSRPDSWFFAYEMDDGTSTFRAGTGIPAALRQFIDRISQVPDLCSTLRVQLGNNDSFVAWAKTSWASYGIPRALEAELCQLSSAHMRSTTVTRGSLKGTLNRITWHGAGSYYVEGQEGYFWHFEAITTREAWIKLWSRKNATPSLEELSELVLVALDPHAPVGETFAFIKKQHDAQEAPFVINFYQDAAHALETPKAAPEVQETRLQHIERKPEKPKLFRWAISKRNGRPHPGESWELELKEGQKVKVWDHMGRDWHIVEGRGGTKGWVHGTWLEFCGSKVHKDPRHNYTLFQDDMRKLLIPGQLREFPPLCEYMSVCSNAACEPLKGGSKPGICIHDLQTLLEGSGCYSYEWLKEERNVWHPDKFARYCHPEHKEHLKTSAQEVFVLYGVLMDMSSQQEDEE
ncbi:hypothetical protein BU25DRAFT_349118 [Macroventuria anomochaeta]|uniref:Uncharacterized protein n=1 Tax=Macroventuria anomochaeta TaxID=301207 RepID=A0ACB6RPJ6_9PLEO|nr:uncharacterized protein BU25DRAFT_349118 [Macroventuria anomochaeta]KAF2623885.1 hypothetical protein BU25DRAFT_349118 [Macroventuria anomochaeta]